VCGYALIDGGGGCGGDALKVIAHCPMMTLNFIM
jgi:hypothetical protein